MNSIGIVKSQVNNKIQRHVLPIFSRLLPKNRIRNWAKKAKIRYRQGLYSPEIILRECVLKQMTSCSARDIETELALTARCAGGKKTTELTPDGKDFCLARLNLPLEVFQKALVSISKRRRPHPTEIYKGLTISMIDGTTSLTPRTDKNRKFFKVSSNQHGENRFPVARIILMVCAGLLATISADPYHTSELAQAAIIFLNLRPQHLILADALYGSFLNLCLLTLRGNHLICPRHPSRKGEVVRRFGTSEWIECLSKPRECHCHAPALLAEMPPSIEVRVIRGIVHRKGYRDFTLVLYTTLLDRKKYSAEEIMALYLRRWRVELDIRSLKLQFGLGRLTCKSPESILREIYSCCLAFNCVRATMAQTGQQLHRLSHARAIQLLLKTDAMMSFASPRYRTRLFAVMLDLLGAALLPIQERPPAPRALVHSVRRFPYLKCTRKQWRAWHRGAA